MSRAAEEAFRAACAQFATGVAVATVLAPDGSPHGLTISSFTSVSLEPPLILICIDYTCSILDHFRLNPYFAVNILSEAQQELSIAFSIKPEGRFEDVAWTPGPDGSPRIAGTLAYIECKIEQIHEVGDHAILIGRARSAASLSGTPLVYFNRSYRTLR